MYKWLVPAIVALSIGSVSDAMAQSRNLQGPKEVPPASFKGQQFVDSRGCVFMRAGLGGQVNWVARISRDRKQLCGQLPTFGANQVKIDDSPLPPKGIAEAAPQIAAKPPAPAAVQPAPTVLSAAPPPAVDKPVADKPAADTAASVKPLSAPIAPPVVTAAAPKPFAVTPTAPPPPKVVVAKPKVVAVPRPELHASQLPPSVVPQGYRRVDPGGRMNTLSGVGGAQGWQAQDQIWTRETPARLIDAPRRTAAVVQEVAVPDAAPQPAARIKDPVRAPKAAAVKSKTPKATGQGRYVQVGLFAEQGNASRAIRQLQALGLPVAKSPLRSGGRQLQSVLAGPFGSATDAQQALRAARGAGFHDAYLR